MATNPIIEALLVKLNATDTQRTNQKLYDFLKDLITTDRMNATAIAGIISGSTPIASLTQDFLTWSNEVATLPNSRELLAGDGILFDDSIANERTVSASVTADYVVMSSGAEPGVPMTDGAGNFIYIEYNP